MKLNSNLVHLHPVSPVTDWDKVLVDWLSTKRSPHTQRVYRNDINDFLSHHDGLTLGKFLTGDRHSAFEIVIQWKGNLISQGLTPATINRRLAAVKSLVSHCYVTGHCEWNLEGIKGERLTAYRDTTGIDINRFKAVLATCDQNTVKGIRDYALLVLLWGKIYREKSLTC